LRDAASGAGENDMDPATTPKRPLLKRRSTRIALVVGAVLVAFWVFKPESKSPDRGTGELINAIVYREYGPPEVVRLEQVEKLLPNDNQVLIKVRAAAANPLDWHYLRGSPYIMRLFGVGLLKPKEPRLGVDVAGVVEMVGKNVTQFKAGDAVFGTGRGAFGEYVRSSENKIALKPPNVSFEQAAAVPVAALTALQGLRDHGKVHAGQKVLINGASGGVGTFAVQIAKTYGAEVTGVCSTRNLELVRSLGADHVIDYTRQDFTQSGQRYDVIYDTVGNHSLAELHRALNPQGIAILIGGGGPDTGHWVGALTSPVKAFFYAPFVSQKFVFFLAEIRKDDLVVMGELMETGKVKPVVDRTYPLGLTAEALRYLEQGHARGKVVVTVAHDEKQQQLAR
jgi:NADPH:quinone reductase-like Zn-dependent oxidoreductase